jgi:flagellin FlaB
LTYIIFHPKGGKHKKKEVKKMKNEKTNENRDNMAAIGIGAMIVFIALILVAAVAAAVIIQTAEKLQQNAQTTGEDTTDMMASKITIKSVIIANTDDLYVTFELAPGSDPVVSDTVEWVITCDDGATGGLDAGNFDDQTTTVRGAVTGTRDMAGAAATTIQPGETYTIQLNPADCTPTANEQHTFMLQSGTGGFTYEVLNYGGSVTDGEVVI